jgi:hypothetical protein
VTGKALVEVKNDDLINNYKNDKSGGKEGSKDEVEDKKKKVSVYMQILTYINIYTCRCLSICTYINKCSYCS